MVRPLRWTWRERLVEVHLLIFGTLFILVVLLLPGGLVEAWARARRLLSRS